MLVVRFSLRRQYRGSNACMPPGLTVYATAVVQLHHQVGRAVIRTLRSTAALTLLRSYLSTREYFSTPVATPRGSSLIRQKALNAASTDLCWPVLATLLLEVRKRV